MNQSNNNDIFQNGSHELSKEQRFEKALKKESKSVLGFFIKNYRVSYLIILAILALGIYSLISLPREADPEVKIPFALVNTIYPGASPTDVEELVTNKIEEKIKNLEGLRRYTSTSNQGLSSIFVEFEAEADLKTSYQKLRDVVAEIKNNIAPEAEDPAVTEIRMSDFPIVTYSLSSDLPEDQLEKYAENIQKKLEGIAGVSKVDIIGGLKKEFQVIIDQTKLINFGISLNQIVSTIARTNFNLPAGSIEIDNFKYNVRVQGKFNQAEAIKDIIVTTREQTPIYVKDLALVNDTYQEEKNLSRLGRPGQDPQNTISLQVYKKTGGNIIDIVKQSNQTIDQLRTDQQIPDYITIEKTDDNSVYIKDNLSTLGISGLQTMVIIIFLLFIVLGLRGAIITGLSVPIAFLMAFIVLYIQGETLNFMVLYSLVISLGLMVDNSIIIMEGTNEYIVRHQQNPLQAALLSISNFKWSVTSGTLTTVAAFAPMLLVSGILGEYFAFIPKTISATLLSSLFVALIVIPTLASRFIKIKNNHNSNSSQPASSSTPTPQTNTNLEQFTQGRKTKRVGKRYQFCTHCVDKIRQKYITLMRLVLQSKKKRKFIIAAVWIVFIIALSVPLSGMMKVDMFPSIDFDRFIVSIEMPPGTVLEITSQKTRQVENIVSQIPEMKSYLTTIGNLASFQGDSQRGSHLSSILVTILPQEERNKKSYLITQQLRKDLKTIQGVKIKVEEVSAGPPSGAPIQVRIYGNDLKILDQLAQATIKTFENIPGTLNVDDTLKESTGEFTFTIDQQKASYYNLDVVSIASTLRNAIYGTKASSVTIDEQEVDITVKYQENSVTNAEDLKNILIINPQGQGIFLKEIADLKFEPSLLGIDHRDGQRVVSITAQLEPQANLQKILSEFEKEKNNFNIPDNYSIQIGGELEDIQKSFSEVFMSMIIAIILIAFILVLQFNSFKQPLIILFTLPLAVIGVIIGLNIMRMSFSFPAFLGIVSLAGIAVNDAIVLIDRINKNLKYGMDKVEGIIEAGVARMQPILLTTLTTVAGIVPLYFADELWRGFSVTLIFGLIFSTGLTLIIVPIMYLNLTKKKKSSTK